jgi:hypothetical protein
MDGDENALLGANAGNAGADAGQGTGAAGAPAGSQEGGGESLLGGNADAGDNGDPSAGEAAGNQGGAYEPLVTPEGLELDNETRSEINALGAELGLTQAQLQRVFDFGVSHGVFGGQELDELMLKTREKLKALDRQKVLSDPELKGSLGDANRVLTRFDADGKVLATLKFYGLENSPDIVRFFGAIGRVFRESGFVTVAPGNARAASGAGSLREMASAVYPPSVMR